METLSISISCITDNGKGINTIRQVFFFRDRAWARISLRREESELQDKGWFQRRETNPHKAKDYTAPKARPDDRPRATTSGSRRRKPA